MEHNGRSKIHKSATRELQIVVEEAEARGFNEGFEAGMKTRAKLDVEYLERHGLKEAAELIRNAKTERIEN